MNLDHENAEIIERFLKNVVRDLWVDHDDPDSLVIGDDVSDVRGVKVIFDGFGDLETTDGQGNDLYVEGGNKNMQSFAIFIHRTSHQCEFPEHESAWNMILHRPDDEVCFYGWYDVPSDYWEFVNIWDNDSNLSEADLMQIILALNEQFYPESNSGDDCDTDGMINK